MARAKRTRIYSSWDKIPNDPISLVWDSTYSERNEPHKPEVCLVVGEKTVTLNQQEVEELGIALFDMLDGWDTQQEKLNREHEKYLERRAKLKAEEAAQN